MTSCVLFFGSIVSACRKSNMSPFATPAPAFICFARPRDELTTWSTKGVASLIVLSLLSPSEMTISCPCALIACNGFRQSMMHEASFNVGMMIDRCMAIMENNKLLDGLLNKSIAQYTGGWLEAPDLIG